MPNNCVFLVDTYDTLEGARNAVEVGKRLREQGHEMVGIRLDSGDLAYLSLEARKILDAGGFPDAAIVASNDLDEHIIESLKAQGAKIAVWGVGTKLATAYDPASLGRRLQARRHEGRCRRVAPQSQALGAGGQDHHSWRVAGATLSHSDNLAGDMIYDETRGIDTREIIVDVKDGNRRKRMHAGAVGEDLLVPVLRGGELAGSFADGAETLEVARKRATHQLAGLDPSVRRLLNPHEHPVGIDVGLHERRDQMIREVRWDFAEQA